MQGSWEGFCTSGTMVCILTHGSRRGVRRKWQGQKPLIFMRFHGVSLGNQHKIWSKQHNGKVSFFRRLHVRECQLDELWTFMAKKEARVTSLEKLAAIAGDAWVWIAFSPVDKLVLAWVVGKRTLCAARQLVAQLKSATDDHIPFFTSDALPHYADALLEVYGVWMTPPRQGTRGRFPHPRRCPPPGLCYAIVVKERKHGRVIHVT